MPPRRSACRLILPQPRQRPNSAQGFVFAGLSATDPIASLTGDGAYDQDGVYGEVAARHPDAAVIVPPRSSGVPSETA
jgi:hypothetical protein